MSWLLPPLPPKFEAALRDVNATGRDARVAAAERLGRADAEQVDAALAGLTSLARDREPAVRCAAVRALAELDDARALDTLEDRLADPDALVREHAAIALGVVSTSDAAYVLERALDSAHPEVRFQALAGYVERAEAPEIGALLPRLADSDVQVRAQAARALGELPAHAPLSIERLLRALRDEHAGVRREAAFALARLGDATGRKELEAALEQRADRVEALEAIASLGLRELADEVARIAVRPWLPAPERMAAARCLARLGDPRGAGMLRDWLRSVLRTRRLLALATIAELRCGALTEDVVALASRPRRVDGGLLVEALAALAPEHAAAREALASLGRGTGLLADHAREALATPDMASPTASPPSPTSPTRP